MGLMNNSIILQHSYYQVCGSTLLAIAQKDYGNKYSFSSEIKALDMDQYEALKAQKEKRNRRSTMDAVIEAADSPNAKAKLQLIELRMKYNNPQNCKASEIQNKVTYTKQLLVGTGTGIIHDKFLFIFNDRVSAQARNLFNRYRKQGGVLRQCYSMSVTEFNTTP